MRDEELLVMTWSISTRHRNRTWARGGGSVLGVNSPFSSITAEEGKTAYIGPSNTALLNIFSAISRVPASVVKLLARTEIRQPPCAALLMKS
jgi:hypothetical protein